jgi:hypothetical protein
MDYLQSQEELDNEIHHAETQMKPLKVEIKEKDFNNHDMVYIEIESLLIDKSGVDYEKLLNSISLDNLTKGVKSGSIEELISFEEEGVSDDEEEVKAKKENLREMKLRK